LIQLPITGGFYESDSLPISAQECVNWYVNIPQTEGALTTGNLFGTAGLVQLETSGTFGNANRGSHVKDGLPYFLNGETLYRLDRAVDVLGVESFNLVALGTIPGTDRASFADNGKQLMIVVGGEGWIIDESSGTPFQMIADLDFKANGTPQQVVFIDSFFLVTTDSKKFIRSESNDGLNWNALNFFTAEADPDDIVAPIIFKNQAFIAGSETIEVFQDVAGQFQRISGMIINKGVFAPFGIINTSDSFMFVGGGVNESPAIWSFVGNGVQKVSTTAIDSVLGKFSQEDIENSFAYSYAQNGAYFVGFSFPRVTFEYNTITGRWHTRTSQTTDVLGLTITGRWRVNSMVTAYNKIICGDAVDGRIGHLDAETFTEYGREMIRTFATMPFQNQGASFSVSRLEATMESGVGDATTDPQIRLSVSKDGKTFNNELWRGFGKIGEYNRRAIWRSLGRFPRFCVLKFEMSEKVKPVFIKLEAKIKQGARE
jgi:hypothetical protein